MWQLTISTLNRVYARTVHLPSLLHPSLHSSTYPSSLAVSTHPTDINMHSHALYIFKQSVGPVSRCHNAHVTSSLSLKFNAVTEMSFRPLHFAPRLEMPPRRATMYWLFWLGNFTYLYRSLYLLVSRIFCTSSEWLSANWPLRELEKISLADNKTQHAIFNLFCEPRGSAAWYLKCGHTAALCWACSARAT